MDVNDLLKAKHIDPKDVLILRHRPTEPTLRKVFPWLASERPDLVQAYQQTQSKSAERAMQKAKFVLGLFGHAPQKAVFVGLYEVRGSKSLTQRAFWRIRAHKELRTYGMRGFRADSDRKKILRFNTRLIESFYHQWKGRLVVEWPPPELAWFRRAERNVIPISAICEESLLNEAMPSWDQINLSWDELAVIPRHWETRLKEWRGIYFIFDERDGKGYVGSAYGADNLLGRWRDYAAKGHGGNKLLRRRKPKTFRFSVLQRVSPDMEASELIRLENSWKERLHTRAPYGLNGN